MKKTITGPILIMCLFFILGISFCWNGTFSIYHEGGHYHYGVDKGWKVNIIDDTHTILVHRPDYGFLMAGFMQEWIGVCAMAMILLILSAFWYPLLAFVGVPFGYLHALIFYPLRSSDFQKIHEYFEVDPVGYWLILTMTSCLVGWILIGWVVRARAVWVKNQGE